MVQVLVEPAASGKAFRAMTPPIVVGGRVRPREREGQDVAWRHRQRCWTSRSPECLSAVESHRQPGPGMVFPSLPMRLRSLRASRGHCANVRPAHISRDRPRRAGRPRSGSVPSARAAAMPRQRRPADARAQCQHWHQARQPGMEAHFALGLAALAVRGSARPPIRAAGRPLRRSPADTAFHRRGGHSLAQQARQAREVVDMVGAQLRVWVSVCGGAATKKPSGPASMA